MIDLHIHLDGSLPLEELPALAELGQTRLPATDADALKKLLCVSLGCTSLAEYLQKFELPLQVLQTAPALEYAAGSLIRQLVAQGLCYAEPRFAPQSHRQRGLTQQQVVEAVLQGMTQASRQLGFPAQLILCCMRGENNQQENMETVELAAAFLGKGVCAVDLAGAEAAYPNEQFAPVFRHAQALGVPIVLHAGEAAGPASVRSALTMGAVRIGHGTRSIQDPALVEELARRRMVLETCFTSNLQTKAVSGPEEYPLRRLMRAGVPVTVNTDNMTVSDTTLHQEYTRLARQCQLEEGELLALALNAADAALLPDAQREALRKRVEQGFGGWLAGAAQ